MAFGAGAGGGRRPFFRRRKTCPFSGANAPKIDYKDVKLLSRYVSERGKQTEMLRNVPCTELYAPKRDAHICWIGETHQSFFDFYLHNRHCTWIVNDDVVGYGFVNTAAAPCLSYGTGANHSMADIRPHTTPHRDFIALLPTLLDSRPNP